MTARRVVVVTVGLAAVLLMVAGCTLREGSNDTSAAANPTTTTSTASADETAGATTTSTLAGQTADQIRASLTAAVAARNFCALTAALDNAVPAVTDGPSVVSTYEAIDSAVHEATAFRPTALADSWTEVVTGVDQGTAAAKTAGGNLGDPTVQAPFTGSTFEAAMTNVESWSDTNCTPG